MYFLDKKKMIWPYAVIIFFIILDRFLKFLAVNDYFDSGISIFEEIFKLNLAKNYHIAFSLPISGVWLNLIIGIIILALFYYFFVLLKRGSNFLSVVIIAIALGASSNLFDRLKYGFVVDYLDLKYFTVFNLADAMIVAGAVALFIFWPTIDKK